MISKKNIVLFDGDCNLCNFWVQYIIKRDKKDNFRFASLQSNVGIRLRKDYQVDKSIDSIVFIEDNKYTIKSTAAFRVLRCLGGIRSILYLLIFVPRFIRDFIYDLVSKNRYKWFGKRSCEFIPNEDIKDKFLT